MISFTIPVALLWLTSSLAESPAVPAPGATSAAPPAPMGEEAFGNEPVPNNDQWAAGVLAVANDPHRVYRRWVNGNEEFFFEGDTQAVHSALARFAAIEADVREVILMPNAGATRSFEDVAVAHGWRLYAPSGICLAMAHKDPSPVYPVHATLTVHVTGAIDLARLSIPDGVVLVGHDDLLARYHAGPMTQDQQRRGVLYDAIARLRSLTKPADEAEVRRQAALRAFIDEARRVDLVLAFDEDERTFSAALVNRRAVPVTLVLPGDGSEPGMRTPFIRWTMHDAETGEKRGTGWIGCGTIDPLRAEEVVTLAPGERRAIPVSRRLSVPGTYRVVLHYDHDPARGLPKGQNEPDVLARVRASERLILSSRPIEITVR